MPSLKRWGQNGDFVTAFKNWVCGIHIQVGRAWPGARLKHAPRSFRWTAGRCGSTFNGEPQRLGPGSLYPDKALFTHILGCGVRSEPIYCSWELESKCLPKTARYPKTSWKTEHGFLFWIIIMGKPCESWVRWGNGGEPSCHIARSWYAWFFQKGFCRNRVVFGKVQGMSSLKAYETVGGTRTVISLQGKAEKRNERIHFWGKAACGEQTLRSLICCVKK